VLTTVRLHINNKNKIITFITYKNKKINIIRYSKYTFKRWNVFPPCTLVT